MFRVEFSMHVAYNFRTLIETLRLILHCFNRNLIAQLFAI